MTHKLFLYNNVFNADAGREGKVEGKSFPSLVQFKLL